MSLSEVQKQTQNVSQVTPEKENWNIIVRVIRSWFFPNFTKQRCPFSMELVIQDKEVIILLIIYHHCYEQNICMLNIFIFIILMYFRVLKYMLPSDVL